MKAAILKSGSTFENSLDLGSKALSYRNLGSTIKTSDLAADDSYD